ncbi:MAG: HK97 family phage prohead protease [Oscillospiraceae bacterium]|nr:HK97 family phage prohead protease [Oscillospiraceae bacterium]
MPVKSDREYRSMTMAAAEEGDYTVRGYATTFDDPYVLYEDKDVILREIIDHDALRDADMSDVIMQYDHEGRVFARTSNDTLIVDPDAHGLAMEARLGGTSLGRGLFEEIKGGYTTKMSWAFTVNRERDEWKTETAPDGRQLETRIIHSVRKVYDVSAVSLPANDATEISARNLADGVIERVKAERLEALELRKRKMLLEDWLK